MVIINKHDYIHEGETMLKGNQYTEIYADMTSETVNLVKKQLYLMLCDESIDQNTYDYLYPKEHKIRTPHCYFLPKIHKITPADRVFVGRNIVSNCGGPCEKNRRIYRLLLSPLCTKSIYILEGHERRDKKN